MRRLKDSAFGEVALASEFITRDELIRCINIQKRENFRRKLGDVCVAEGALSPEARDFIVRNQALIKERGIDHVDEFLLAKSLVRLNMLSHDTVARAQAQCSQSGEKKSLGEILVEMGELSAEQVVLVSSNSQFMLTATPQTARQSLSFGELAVQMNKLTEEQLAHALRVQANGDDRRLGEICVALNYIRRQDLSQILEEQLSRASLVSPKSELKQEEVDRDPVRDNAPVLDVEAELESLLAEWRTARSQSLLRKGMLTLLLKLE